MKNNNHTQMLEEIDSEKDLVKKQQLLQKFGLIPAKLTADEKALVILEENNFRIDGGIYE